MAAERLQACVEDIVFADDAASVRGDPSMRIAFADLACAAYEARVHLSATGFYRTPGLHWDPAAGQGHPFYYYAFGAAVSEVEVCGHTGVHVLRRVDILHDVGDPLVEAIDRGQVEGGFVQGLGCDLRGAALGPRGKLLTDAPSTYKIPPSAKCRATCA